MDRTTFENKMHESGYSVVRCVDGITYRDFDVQQKWVEVRNEDRHIDAELEQLRRAVCLDCQPKSKDDTVYVSLEWRNRILELANAPITPELGPPFHINMLLAAMGM